MQKKQIKLELLEKNDREQFIIDNQISFKYGALVEFGKRDDHLDDDGEIISRETIEKCIDDPDNVAYRTVWENIKVGGIVVKIDNKTHYNYLELFLFLLITTIKESVLLLGKHLKKCIRKQKCGKHVLHILKKETFIFMLTNVNFIL